MFIKNSKFKALLKDAYKNHTLNVGRTDPGVFIIDAPTWHLEAMEEFLTNEIKAMVVELVGDLPAAGQAWTYKETQEAPQEMMIDCIYENLWESVEKQKWIDMEYTRVYMRTDQEMYNMIQSKTLSSDNSFISESFIAAVDPRVCSKQEELHGPMMNELSTILWYSQEMAFRCNTKHLSFSGEKELLDATTGLDMNWIQSEQNQI